VASISGELDERADHPEPAKELGHDEHEIGGRRAKRQLAGQPDADDAGHRLIEGLAEEDGLRLDAADPVAEDAEAVDHRRVGVGSDERVGKRDSALIVIPVGDDGRQVFEVDLVDDARPGRHDPEVAEGRLGPAQQLVALAVPLVLAIDVERERRRRPEGVDLDRMVDDEIGRDQRVDPGRIAAEVGHRVAHRREVDDRRHAREVLENDPRRHERDLGGRRRARSPGGERLDIVGARHRAAGVAEDVLQEDLEGHRGPSQIDSVVEGAQPVDIRQAGSERPSGPERIARSHVDSTLVCR